MIEFEHIMTQLERLHLKEKSLRNKVLLENAIVSLKEYDKFSTQGDGTFIKK
ncbi:MAG TPA: hypothetical protein VFF13_01745 [archaeon]|nr:hypothetical protein [archaeon]